MKYNYKKRENKFTENGHTMFEVDVLQRLNRLTYLENKIEMSKQKPLISESEHNKIELTKFLDFLLISGYCDSDVYDELPSAIDRYMHPELDK